MSDDFNKMRLLVKKLVKTKFRKPYQFRIAIDGEPSDFDIFVKDITFGPTTVENEPDKVGSTTITWPTGLGPVKLSMTMRDDEKCSISKWFDEWTGKVCNQDGTVNLPYGANGYVKKVKLYRISDDGAEEIESTWEMYPENRGDVTMSREEHTTFLEFPCTFQQFRTNDGTI